jgi:nitrogen fixation/metabolism regulation signal transduction histidine kinase
VAPFAEIALRQFASSGMRQWEEQVEYRRADGQQRTLLIRGTRLGKSGESGYVVVFDDVTHLIQAQRDAAWGEVARRLAHEIKNPLTPIQLSAERLQQKLKDKLPEHEADILKRATGTIVNHVAALKGMVDDFTQYAHASRMNARCSCCTRPWESRSSPASRTTCLRSTRIPRCCGRSSTTSSRTRSTL